MPNWFKDNSQSIGHTPMVRLNHIINDAPAAVLGKIEGCNPVYSVKCRMIDNVQHQALLCTEKELIELTSGNTGVASVFGAATRSIPLRVIMTDSGERYPDSAFFESCLMRNG